MKPGFCYCGRPLHYTDPELQRKMENIVADLGEYMSVTVGGLTWRVPRHYIALHGIKGSEVSTLGFEQEYSDEWVKDSIAAGYIAAQIDRYMGGEEFKQRVRKLSSNYPSLAPSAMRQQILELAKARGIPEEYTRLPDWLTARFEDPHVIETARRIQQAADRAARGRRN